MKWNKLAEKEPKDSTLVDIVVYGLGRVIDCLYMKEREYFYTGEKYIPCSRVTYWAYSPSIPKE